MRFYNIKTPHNQSYLDDIIMSLSLPETDYILSLYNKISMVEYTDRIGNECLYAILDSHLIEKLSELYRRYDIKFNVFDITKDVIFDNKIPMNYKNNRNKPVKKDVLKLIDQFKLNWVSKDDILDKIIEKGISSLSEIDFEILSS